MQTQAEVKNLVEIITREVLVALREEELPKDHVHSEHCTEECADGICGVCKCAIVAGQVEHRDFVLSNQQRQTHMILCQSRAAQPDGILEVDL